MSSKGEMKISLKEIIYHDERDQVSTPEKRFHYMPLRPGIAGQ
jgi:hypothetical protein